MIIMYIIYKGIPQKVKKIQLLVCQAWYFIKKIIKIYNLCLKWAITTDNEKLEKK